MSNVYELLEQIEDMDYGPERVALNEEAVRQADLLGDEQAGYDARMALIDSANMSGQSEKMFAPFAWCQNYAERHPDGVSDYTLAWYHKWLLGSALQFPQIPLSRMYELHESYARHARRLGAGAASIPYLQLSLAMHTGDHAGARRAFNVWQFARREMLSDCPACEANQVAEYHAFMGDHAACVRQSETIIAKNMTCGHMPHLTYGGVLRSLVQLGRLDEARDYAATGREMVAGDPDFLGTQAEHLEFLALTDPAAGLDWYAQHLPWAEATRERLAQMEFHAAAAQLFARLEQSGQTEVRLTLPPTVAGHAIGGLYPVAERLHHHRAAAEALAQQFDQRNGTNYHRARLASTFSS